MSGEYLTCGVCGGRSLEVHYDGADCFSCGTIWDCDGTHPGPNVHRNADGKLYYSAPAPARDWTDELYDAPAPVLGFMSLDQGLEGVA